MKILPHPFLLAAFALTLPSVRADTYTWDITPGDGVVTGGAGTWDTTSALWTKDAGVTDVVWTNLATDDAVFSGTGGEVTWNSVITAGSVSVGSGYTVSYGAGANGSSVGAITLAGSRLNLAAGAVLASNPAQAITLNAGSVLYLFGAGAGASVGKNIVLNGGSFAFDSGNSSTFTGVFSGSGDLNMNLASNSFGNKLTMTSSAFSNTYTGNTNIVNNLVQLNGYTLSTFTPFGTDTSKTLTLTGQAGSWNPVAGIIFNPTGTGSTYTIGQKLALTSNDGNIAYIQNNDGILRFTGATTVSTDATAGSMIKLITQYTGKDIYLDGPVSGVGKLLVSDIAGSYGSGTVHLTNTANTYSGTITVDDSSGAFGILSLDAANAGAFASVDLAGATNGGRLRVNAANVAVAGLTGAASTAAVFTTSATVQTLTVNNAGANAYAGAIGVAGTYAYDGYAPNTTTNGANLALVKTGAGALTLTGTSAYVGGTTLSAGSIITGNVSALGAGAVAVAGGTLQVGNGATNTLTLGGTLTVSSGTLDLATNGTAAITLTGAANFALSGSGVWKVGSLTDAITLGTGTFALSGGKIDLTGFANKAVNGTYSLISGTGVSSLTSADFINGDSLKSYSINAAGDLVVSSVPEPSAYGLAGAGALAAVALVRRRRKTAV